MPAKGVAVVTGASYGLGASIATLLAVKAKYEVVLVARSLEKLRQVQFEIAQQGGVALAVKADITDQDDIKELVDKTLQAFPGGVDILVNNAAYVAPLHKFADGDQEEWKKMINVNVWGTLNCTKAFLPGMLEKNKGKVVFISSKAGVSPSAGLAVHSGTKHLVEAIAGAIRQEVANTGVSIGIVRPGGIATPGYQHAAGNPESRVVAASIGSWVPGKTTDCLQPEAVANLVVNMVEAMEMGADVTEISVKSYA